MKNTIILTFILSAIFFTFAHFAYGINGVINLLIAHIVISAVFILAKVLVYLVPKSINEILGENE